jgi:hypothetical protein
MPETEKETKQKIGAAIVAASEKDYVGFKGAIGDEVEDRLRTAIGAAAQDKRDSQFTKIATPEAEVEANDTQDDE